MSSPRDQPDVVIAGPQRRTRPGRGHIDVLTTDELDRRQGPVLTATHDTPPRST
jgi:hypothetical protein